MRRNIRDDETGAVLVLALAFIAFIGVIGVVLLNYAHTNIHATIALRPVRSMNYSADGAVEGAINKLRHDPASTPCVATFYRSVPVLNNQEIVLDCGNRVQVLTPPSVTVTFTAKCPTPGSDVCPAGTPLLSARVRYDGTPPAVATTVESWSAKR